MYICPKCGGSASKERITVPTYTEDFSVKTGDIKCCKCGYVGSKKEFTKDNKEGL